MKTRRSLSCAPRPRRASRRDFLVSGAALLVGTPFLARADFPSNPDVIIIGAGAAGISAAKILLKNNRSVAVLEAAPRIGGRVHTDSAIFGTSYDVGAHWLHYSERNPFVRYGRENGFTIYPTSHEQLLYVDGRAANDEEYKAFENLEDAALKAIEKAGAKRQDVSPASIMPDLGEWHDTLHLWVGPYEMAKDFSHFSCADWYTGEDGSDHYCKEGYGALFAHSARDVPVQLSAKVEKVKWNGKGVTVATTRGELSAKACIVTVSTGVLASGAIQFSPPLPPDKQESFHGITMGIYNHIALQFRQNFFGVGEDGYLLRKLKPAKAASPKGMVVLVNASGSGISYADVGGEFARDLEKAGTRVAIDFALSELRAMYGGEVDKHFVKAHATTWGNDPLFYGSYASAEPGKWKMRKVLRQPVGKRVYFAGEALSRDDWSTVAGAHKSGIRTANKVLAEAA